jgi:hypothetical protein
LPKAVFRPKDPPGFRVRGIGRLDVHVNFEFKVRRRPEAGGGSSFPPSIEMKRNVRANSRLANAEVDQHVRDAETADPVILIISWFRPAKRPSCRPAS